MTAATLIVRAQSGDRDSAAELVSRYMRYALAAVRGLYVPGLDRDDVEQELRWAILRAVRVADPSRPLAPLVSVAARRRIVWLIEQQRRDRHWANHHTADAAVLDHRAEVVRLGPVEHLEWREETRRLARGVRGLSPVERRSVLGLAIGLTCAEIDGDDRRVDNAAQRARRKLREAA